MFILIIAVAIAVGIAFVSVRVYAQIKGSQAAVAQFELPADSDKESFMDPKTGKRYDKAGYDAYLQKTVERMTSPQLEKLITQYGGQNDVWNQLMCEAIRAEQARRAEAEESAVSENEEEAEEINEEIAPFFWVEQSTGASVGLTVGTYLQEELTSGRDWDKLAKCFLREQNSRVLGKLEFDSQEDMFSVYSRDTAALRKFAGDFKALCEDPGQCAALLEKLSQ